MKIFKVTFADTQESETEADAYASFIKYLRECVITEDVSAFEFEEQD